MAAITEHATSPSIPADERRRELLNAAIRYTLLTAVGLLMLYPLIWLVGASFKTNSEIFGNAGFIPQNPTLEGYIRGWETSTPYTFGRFFWNTFLIILPKTIFTAISCALVAYGFARFEFPGKKILFASLIATLLLPNVVTRIPQYILFRDLGWLDSFLPLWVPSALAGDAFFVFMLVQFLRAIPRDMEEAARVDGANSMQTLIYIVVPMLTPALISVCLFQFMWTMNDFLGPLIYISSVDKFPISLALKLSIDTTEAFEWNRILAMSVLALLPALVVFFMAQKYFIEGISTGGVKG
ncbi:MAG: carbohydrate ABC transporter permease [Paracoccus sp. (in: a-proteobacteria)]|nr:carbohydrate ABC transporter permease [Paracoccus sp. (in: a-proteobacteria)]